MSQTMDDELRNDIIKSISLRGAADDDNIVSNPIILGSRNNLNHIASTSSGRLRIHNSIIKKFILILSTPAILSSLSTFEIRCVLCRKVISYPCWYYSIRYAVNHFHYFVCFDSDSNDKPNTKCYRR